MFTWIAIAYGVIVLGFIVTMYAEAPKHYAEVGLGHYVVALAWPIWGVWYLWVIISEWFVKRRKENELRKRSQQI